MKPPTTDEQQLAFLRELLPVFERHNIDVEVVEESRGYQMMVDSVDFNLDRNYRDDDGVLRSQSTWVSFKPYGLDATSIKEKIKLLEG